MKTKSNDHPYSCNPELASVDIFACGFILPVHSLKKHKPTGYISTLFSETISTIWNRINP